VFGRKDRNTSPVAGNSRSYLSNHFSDVRQAARAQATSSGADVAQKTFQKQKELEKLLMKAENEDIGMLLTHSHQLCSCQQSVTIVQRFMVDEEKIKRAVNWLL